MNDSADPAAAADAARPDQGPPSAPESTPIGDIAPVPPLSAEAQTPEPAQEPPPDDQGQAQPEPADIEADELESRVLPSLAEDAPSEFSADPYPESVHDESHPDQPADLSESQGKEPLVVVRYGAMRQIGQFRYSLDNPPPRGVKAVIRTDRGVELGEVLAAILPDDQSPPPCRPDCLTCAQVEGYLKSCGPEYPYSRQGKILRLATPQDLNDQAHLERSGKEELTFCKQQVAELHLQMRLVGVENLLGGERIIFYFTAENRVDFRELVRRLAGQYRTRIEMRQVGARDEARMVADYERCGQRCCCQEFLKDLQPVSIRMAKTQKATLDPAKISGRCGRLMCCLRYEDEGYEELRRKLPKKGIWVRTAALVGRVIETQILSQLVRVVTIDGTVSAVANEAILERNVPPPPMPTPSDRPSRGEFGNRNRRVAPQPRMDEPIVARPSQSSENDPWPGEEDSGAPAEVTAAPAHHPEHEDIEIAAVDADDGADDDQAPLPAADGAAPGEAPRKKRRRRRRKSGQGQAQDQPAGPGDDQPQTESAGDGDSADGPDDASESQEPHGDSGQPGQAPDQPGQAGTGRKRRRRRRRRGGRSDAPADNAGQGGAPPPPPAEG